ncbi:MAG: hypothetical protein E5Y81_19000, partial [Mesorhizobium sp.]
SGLPAISPSRGEISSFARIPTIRGAGDWRQAAIQLISPLVGEMAGRPEGGAVPPTYQRIA